MPILTRTDSVLTKLCCLLPSRLVFIRAARVGINTVDYVHISFGWFPRKV